MVDGEIYSPARVPDRSSDARWHGNDSAALARRRINENIEAHRRLLLDGRAIDVVVLMAKTVAHALNAGKKLLIFGNGGSAADAQHIASELLGRYLIERRSLPALALADCSAAITAIGNDYDYGDVFARQLSGLGVAGDVALAISTSGTSTNVTRAVSTARSMGLTTIAITGAHDSPLLEMSDLCLRVPTFETPRIQECYMLVAHILCELVELSLAAPGP